MTLTFSLPLHWSLRYELDYIPESYHNDDIQAALISLIDIQLGNSRRVRENRGKVVETFAYKKKKGMVDPVGCGKVRKDLKEKKEARMYEMGKLLAMTEIRIIDGGDEGEVLGANNMDVKRRTSLTTAVALLRRQRYRKYSVGERKKEAMGTVVVENPFVALAGARYMGTEPENEYLVQDDEDDLAAYR